MSERVREILSWYAGENPGVLNNLARIMMTGALAGTGRFVILPVDQGFEHGPVRSFGPNPDGYDPRYHFQLAIDAGCNAYAAPLGFIEAGAAEYAGRIPTILKLNNHDTLSPDTADPIMSVTGSVQDALSPGSGGYKSMYEDLAELTREAKAKGLAVVVWSYPRGSGITKEGETAVDIAGYAAQIAAQLGANIIKVKPPTDHIMQPEAKKVFDAQKIPTATLAERVRHVVQSAFGGRRIVIFSGGAKGADEKIFDECTGIRDGGGFGSIIGRNSFQRKKPEALKFLATVMDIYRGKA
jgi:class I fructose-bisphosphate aldolase